MKEGTNPWIAFVSNCTALVLSVESAESKLSLPPTHRNPRAKKASEQYRLKETKRARY
jgi:hypothetical protein